MRTILSVLLGFAMALAAPLAAADEKPALPGWMTGAWIETKGESWTEEYWTPPRGGLMIGAGRNGKGKELAGWEATRIEIDKAGKLAFVALPNGGPATRFAIESVSADAISFTNPKHDYPQRVRYWREGKALMAETSLIDGSNAMRWHYSPMGE